MTPQEVLDAIVRALQQSDVFNAAAYETEEVDLEATNNRLPQPFVSFQPVSKVRADRWNTDFIGYTTDDAGNRTGKIYEATFDPMDVQADIWVAEGNASLDATELGGNFEEALYYHDSQGPDEPFPDGNGGTADDIEEFLIGDGRRQDDLSGPGVRRWRHDLTVAFTMRVTTDVEYVEVVDTPTSGTATGGSENEAGVAIELTVS